MNFGQIQAISQSSLINIEQQNNADDEYFGDDDENGLGQDCDHGHNAAAFYDDDDLDQQCEHDHNCYHGPRP